MWIDTNNDETIREDRPNDTEASGNQIDNAIQLKILNFTELDVSKIIFIELHVISINLWYVEIGNRLFFTYES